MSQLEIAFRAFGMTGAICLFATAAWASEADPTFSGKIGQYQKNSTPSWPTPATAPQGAPNVVLVLLDDVGFGAASTFGGPVRTPAFEQLAAQGLRYNQFHTTAVCSPTRAALLSGRNHHRVGFGVAGGESGFPGYNFEWKQSAGSIAEVLHLNGYSTSAFGKWHNTPIWEINPVGPFDHWPTSLGFDYFYGFMGGEMSQWEPMLYRNTQPVSPPADDPAYILNHDLANDAIHWIHSHDAVAPDRPYFLYFASGGTHSPHHVPKEWIDKYRGQFDQGWDRLREEIFARQQKLGVIPANAELTPRPDALPAWSSLSTDQQKLASRQMEVYAGFLAETDAEVGRVIAAAQQGPHGDNTIVIYIMGDNGASSEGGLGGSDRDLAEFFMGVPADDIKTQLARSGDLGSRAYDNHFASGWSWGLDAPFQWMKQVASHLGGTRNPMVVSWPDRIKDQGGLRSQFTHVVDVAPTLYEVIGIQPPESIGGVKQMSLDGVSFASSFTDAKVPDAHTSQYFEIMGNRAMYKDGWIASARHELPWMTLPQRKEDFENDQWELYNLNEDYSQAHDLANADPDKLKELQALFDSEAKRNDVYPIGLGMPKPGGNGAPSLVGDRKDFTYYADSDAIPPMAGPMLLGSHSITVDLVVPGKGAEGVIFADGGRYGGVVLYVKKGRLIYENNFFGKSRDVIAAASLLPPGQHRIAYEYTRQDAKFWGGGRGTLSIDGKTVAKAKIPQVGMPYAFGSLDIGRERGSPISPDYQLPFTFTGTIEKLEIHLGPPALEQAVKAPASD
ncbi:MAG: sulfatase [Rhodospirillales bacterium]|nr:sulfatase [Rhodospirillales bacterium]